MTETARYGSWRSPITSELLVSQVVGLADPLADGEELYFVERRPFEAGRQVVVRRDRHGALHDVLPEGYSARTLVHEYGGLSFAVRGGRLLFSNLADQRLYRLDRGAAPVAVTPEPPEAGAFRYGAPVLVPDGSFAVCVREQHLGGEVVNDLVAVACDGSGVEVLASGRDFYGAPALSPDGGRVAWCCWDHPRMPWDGTELWQAELASGPRLRDDRLVAGGADESVSQPRYSPEGVLHFVSDRTGWWNLYVADGSPGGRLLLGAAAEFAGPDWVLGLSSYAPLGGGRLVASWSAEGRGFLGTVRADGASGGGSGGLEVLASPYSVFSGVQPFADGIVCLAASELEPPALVAVSLPEGEHEVLRPSRELAVDVAYLSTPEHLAFESRDGATGHALVYLPVNPDFAAPEGELPPLLVSVHGGPTGAASRALDYGVQFWTSRGFAVAAVDYAGSAGYGREYRLRLNGEWGVLDLADCEAAARALAGRGVVDPGRLLVHGGSAGGYTVLCAATFGAVFVAGASYFGVSDLGALARETHKFESRYLDGLVGPWPEARDRYEARSPLFHTELLHIPLVVFQGLEDRVVPPSQAELIVEAMRARGLPVAYLAYEGEQHGFRRAEHIRRTAEAELFFYGQILGIEPADDLEPVEIVNLPPPGG